MTHYAGIDVSLETSSICIVDGSGAVLRELKVVSEPEALSRAGGMLAPVAPAPLIDPPSVPKRRLNASTSPAFRR